MGPIRSKEAGCSATTGSGSGTPTKPYVKRQQERMRPPSATVVDSDSDDEVQFVEDLGLTGESRRRTSSSSARGSSQSQQTSSGARRASSDKSKTETGKGKGNASFHIPKISVFSHSVMPFESYGTNRP